MRWLSFRYDLTSDEGWSSSPWIELGDWTRFLYNNYNFYEGNNIHWEHFYVGIFRCNQVLAHVPSIEMDETTKNQVLAQASFLRALWYFQVNLLWDKGTMPLEPKDASYIPEDASEQEIWDQVEKDLTFAMQYLPESWDASDLDVGCLPLLPKVLPRHCWARLICNNISMTKQRNNYNG